MLLCHEGLLVGSEMEEEGGGSGGLLDSDWNAVAEDEVRAIEAAFTSASSATKRQISHDLGAGDAPFLGPEKRRRLPLWARSDAMPSDRHESDDGCPASYPTNAAWSTPLRRSENAKMRYPKIMFSGRIIYCRTVSEVEQASMKLMEKIRSLRQTKEHIYLGFDVEWRPTFRKGVAQRKAAVMQLCLENCTCYVMHIFHSGIPALLKSVLENDVLIKVGVGIGGDACKIKRDYDVSVEPLEDLSSLANLKLGGAPKQWGLGSLTEMIICKELAKPNRIRLGNWEADLLSKKQLQYAATDAYVSWYLHQALKGYPDATTAEA